MRTRFLVHRCSCSPCPNTEKGMKESFKVSFMRVLIPFLRAPLLLSNHYPKDPFPNTTTLGIRFQHGISGDININSIFWNASGVVSWEGLQTTTHRPAFCFLSKKFTEAQLYTFVCILLLVLYATIAELKSFNRGVKVENIYYIALYFYLFF